MGLEGLNYSADNEKTNSIEAKKSVDWKLVSENLALKTKLAASEIVNNDKLAEEFAESVGLNENKLDTKEKNDIVVEKLQKELNTANKPIGEQVNSFSFWERLMGNKSKLKSDKNFADINLIKNQVKSQLGPSSMNGYIA